MAKSIYFFGGGSAEGNASMKNLLGGKGANLAEMAGLGLPVPAGFTITTEVCTYFSENNDTYPEGLEADAEASIKRIEEVMGSTFGDTENPLLLSVRSGARESMPGMMDTVLNLGLNDETVKGLIAKTENPRFAYDSYRRFVQMYGDVVLGVKAEKGEHDPFEVIMDEIKEKKGVTLDTELDAEDLKTLVTRFKALIKDQIGVDFPEDPRDQLWGAIGAVFKSWNNERAIIYRRLNNIPAEWGTAVNVMAMVYGNLGEDCGTGVAFTRDPATGENVLYGEFLMNAQGEDVVAGIRTPLPVAQLEERDAKSYNDLQTIRATLEKHYREMQDVEFTIQQGKLFMLQTRTGKRTGLAMVKIAVDMVEEGLITKEEALSRIKPADKLSEVLAPIFDANELKKAKQEGHILAKGLNAGPGAATGRIAFDADAAAELEAELAAKWRAEKKKDKNAKKENVILVRLETSPEDIKGMQAAVGILTARGGRSSHAALVARQMGKVCVAGCGALQIDYKAQTLTVGDTVLKAGDWISLDGTEGEVFDGKIETQPSEVEQVLLKGSLDAEKAPTYQAFAKLLSWADEYRKLGVWTNADQPDQAKNAISFGAEGIGLCRTEHMFFGEGKIEKFRQMILAKTVEERKEALEALLPLQREDFEGLFKEMEGRPVTIRTLDPPLHEFLPHDEEEINELAAFIGTTPEYIKRRNEELAESNPMLGHRGCRLGTTYPEITEMQVRAIFEAAVNVKKETGVDPHPEVMIPLVGHINELDGQEVIARRVAEEVFAEKGEKVDYLVGTMIELPRAALTADRIAEKAEFFSFGTNDLTQTTFGLSRDDAVKFLGEYYEKDILPQDPFATIDRDGVGQLMQIAVDKGRQTRSDIQLGICGEHGGEPNSVEFCHMLGLNYVSCSPFRVPIARLAAAQAALKEK